MRCLLALQVCVEQALLAGSCRRKRGRRLHKGCRLLMVAWPLLRLLVCCRQPLHLLWLHLEGVLHL